MPDQFTGNGPSFMLRVRGDSMIDAGIFDGDYVVVRQQPDADNGDVVVAGIPDGEATVKTFSRRDGQVVLMPANAAYEPMVFGGPDDVTIFGKVVIALPVSTVLLDAARTSPAPRSTSPTISGTLKPVLDPSSACGRARDRRRRSSPPGSRARRSAATSVQPSFGRTAGRARARARRPAGWSRFGRPRRGAASHTSTRSARRRTSAPICARASSHGAAGAKRRLSTDRRTRRAPRCSCRSRRPRSHGLQRLAVRRARRPSPSSAS